MKQEYKIKYCNKCRKFYTHSCNCYPNAITCRTTIPPSLETCICSTLSLIWKFLYQQNVNSTTVKVNKHFFSKYIYLDSPNSECKINLPNFHDVYVYMLTITSEQELDHKESDKKLMPPQTTSSTISVSSKKSNILANWINKTRKKKKKTDNCLSETSFKSRAIAEEMCYSEDEQSDNSSIQNNHPATKEIPSKSKIPILKPNSSKNIDGSGSGKCRSYVNIAPGEKVEETLKQSKSDADMEPFWRSCTSANSPCFKLAALDLKSKLTLDLQEVTSFVSRLKESEIHIAHLISKFIDDRSFQKELLDIVGNHSKLHIGAELRIHNLTNELWLYQNEIVKSHDATMQERLSNVVRDNRLLQSDVEHLRSKNEKLCIKIQQIPNYVRPSLDGNLLEAMGRNNDQLRYKVSALSKQLEKEEMEFSKLQKKYVLIEQQLQKFNVQLQNYKDEIDRMQIESKLEQELLINELQNSQKVLKESVEAGDVVLEDLDSLKRQFKTMSFKVNLTKFKCRGNSLPDLVYMCRSCINELSKELIQVQNESTLKDKDISSLKQDIVRQETEKHQIKIEHVALQETVNQMKVNEVENQIYKVKYEENEAKLKKHEEEIKGSNCEHQKEIRCLQLSVENLNNLKKEVLEKSEELLLVNEQITTYKSDNDTLRMQLQGLKQVLSATGTGEIARELVETQEKLVMFQSQYYQILSEKNVLIDQLQTAHVEKSSLNQFQSSSSQIIQTQQHELETLKKDNLLLRQQLNAEQKQCTALTIERSKLKEEKNIMKQIYNQLKAEVNRIQNLEGKVAGMNLEANRLAFIAEYNKQLGEKLQTEVTERNVKINELETNVKELNNAQLENAKDKVALCIELKEVCSLNDRLSNTLEFEHHKIDELHQYKRKIEDTVSLQLTVAEQMQKKERTALLELLNEYKIIVHQRDNLLKNQAAQVQQVKDLHANMIILSKNLEEMEKKCMQYTEVIKNLEGNVQTFKEELRKAEETIAQQEKENVEIKTEYLKNKAEGESLNKSIVYLQNTIQQLQKNLNKTRESEMKIQRELENEQKTKGNSEKLLEEQQRNFDLSQKDKEELNQKCATLNTLYEELLQNYKRDKDISHENVESLKHTLKGSKELIARQKDNIEQLQSVLREKETYMDDIKKKCNTYATQISELEQALKESTLESQQFKEVKAEYENLQTNIDSLYKDYRESCEVIANLKEDNDSFQEQLKKAKANHNWYEKYIEEISTKHHEDRKELEQDLETFAIEFQDLRIKYAKETEEKTDMTKQQKQLVEQLLSATEMIIDEKLKNQEVNRQLEAIAQKHQNLLQKKEQDEGNSLRLVEEVNDLKLTIHNHMSDKRKLHKIIAHLENIRDDLQSDINTSESQIIEIRQKYRYLENSHEDIEMTLGNTTKQLKLSQDLVKVMKSQLDDNHIIIMNLESETSNLRQQLIAVEFQRSEAALRLHKLQASLKTEKSINVELTAVNQKYFTEMLKVDGHQSSNQYTCDSDSSSINLHLTL